METVESLIAGTRDQVRLNAWRTVFEKADRIMSGRPVKVVIAEGHGLPGAPGWTDGDTISFHGQMVREMISTTDPVDAVLRLKGLNYHELSHVLYTPRASEDLPRNIRRRTDETPGVAHLWRFAWNALEDQRIETGFSGVYAPAARYFEAAVLQWLLTSGNAEAFILLHGRKYVSPRLRVKASDVFVKKHGQELRDKFAEVIDGYLPLVFPADNVRGLTSVRLYKELLQQLGQSLPDLPIPDNGAGAAGGGKQDVTVVRAGKVTASESKAAKDAIVVAIKVAAEEEAEARADIDAERAEDAAEAAGAASGGQGEESGGSGTGDGSGDHSAPEIDLGDLISDMVEEAGLDLDDVKQDADLQRDVDRVIDAVQSAIRDAWNSEGNTPAKFRPREASPSESGRRASVKSRQILSRIRSEFEPQTLRRQVAGRIDSRRLINRQPHEVDIFSQYDEGREDETGFEAVMLMDASGSMGGRMEDASEAIWALRRAFDKLGVRSTVFLYDTDHATVYGPTDRTPAHVEVFRSAGGTNPTSALDEALRIVHASNMPNRLVINVTDGSWGDRADEKVKALNKIGAVTVLFGLNDAVRKYGKHQHQVAQDLASITEMPRLVTAMVAQVMRVAAGRA